MRARQRRTPRRQLAFNAAAWEAVADQLGLDTDADRARFLGVEQSSYHRITRGLVRPSGVFVAQVLAALRDNPQLRDLTLEDLFSTDDELMAVAA